MDHSGVVNGCIVSSYSVAVESDRVIRSTKLKYTALYTNHVKSKSSPTKPVQSVDNQSAVWERNNSCNLSSQWRQSREASAMKCLQFIISLRRNTFLLNKSNAEIATCLYVPNASCIRSIRGFTSKLLTWKFHLFPRLHNVTYPGVIVKSLDFWWPTAFGRNPLDRPRSLTWDAWLQHRCRPILL